MSSPLLAALVPLSTARDPLPDCKSEVLRREIRLLKRSPCLLPAANRFSVLAEPSMIVAAIWLIRTINRWLEDAHSKLFFPKYARQFIWLQSSPENLGCHLESRSCVR